MTPTVGVIIPTYNRPSDTARALESVLAQTRPADAVVIVDDGSTPPLALPAQLVEPDCVRVLRVRENRGAAAARQAAVAALETSHVAFLDADDLWLPTKLERQLGELAAAGFPPRTALACGWIVTDAEGRPLSVRMPRGSERLEDFVSGCWFAPGSTVLMARQDIIDAGGFDTRLRRLEDYDLFVRFSALGGRLHVSRFCGAEIRRGRNARYCNVAPATRLLREKLAGPGSVARARGLARRVEGWLDVEEAAALYNDGRYAAMAARLMRSFARCPRRRLQLGDWWETDGTRS